MIICRYTIKEDEAMTYYTFTDTPAGRLLLTHNGEKITGIYWLIFKRAPRIDNSWIENGNIFKEALRQLDEYFAGKRQSFDLPYALHGAPFQIDVWHELETIPFGTTRSYQDIATAVGRPKAVRAVGTAIGSNPIVIAVPCHRVLTSLGTIGGYAGGEAAKMRLLQLEKVPRF
jgi:O-6-methylguanine DNA methyltransferase